MRADGSNVLSFAVGRALLRPPQPGSLAAMLANIDAIRTSTNEARQPSFIASLNDSLSNIDEVRARESRRQSLLLIGEL